MTLHLTQRIALLALAAIPAIGFAQQQSAAKLDMDRPAAIQRAIDIGAADPSKVLHLAISMPFGNEEAAQRFADSVSDPSSPNYRMFITPEQVGRQFGLSQPQVQKVVDYLQSQGMKIRLVGKNRLTILADATIAQAQKAFNTNIEQYTSLDTADAEDPYRFSFTTTPSVPAELSGIVANVSGMEDFTRPKKMYLSPSQARTLYGTATMYSGGSHGQGRTIGISSWDGFRLSNAASFISYYGLPTPSAGATTNVKIETVDGGSGTGAQKVEGDMDIQCALAIAPLANVIVYDGYNGDIINVLTLEVNDNTADIITESYGWSLPAATATSAHTLHLSMTAQGITYLAASGDTGTTITYPYPDCETEVLVVGGTSTTTDTAGDRTTEVGWPDSGGGWATAVTNTFNVKPSYQSAVGPSGVNYRLFPDVAANADPNTGYTLYLEAGTYPTFTLATSGVYNGFGGTSAASPTMAASLALAEEQIISQGGLAANSAGKQRFGRINDLLYSYKGLPSVFFDVISGTNGTLPSGATSTAAAGWDTVTGWGAMNFQGLVNKVLGMTVSSLTLSSSSVQGGTSVTGTVKISLAAPTGGEIVSLSSSTASVVTPASVTIAAGATSATFTATTTGVSASTSATITAAVVGSSTTATLTVTPPALSSLTVASTSLYGGLGTTVTGTVTLTGPAPAAGTVVTLASSSTSATLSASSITIASGKTSGTFTFTAAAVNTATAVTFTATLGSVKATATATIQPAVMSAVSISSSSVVGGVTNPTVTVTLNAPAGSSGTVVTLASSVTAAANFGASSVTVAAGKTTATAAVSSYAVSTSTAVTLTATRGVAKTATLTVTPATLSSLTLSVSTLVGNGTTAVTGTVTLTGPAGPSGVTITLKSSNSTAVPVTASVTIAAGAKTGTFTFKPAAVTANTAATITATFGSTSATATITDQL